MFKLLETKTARSLLSLCPKKLNLKVESTGKTHHMLYLSSMYVSLLTCFQWCPQSHEWHIRTSEIEI